MPDRRVLRDGQIVALVFTVGQTRFILAHWIPDSDTEQPHSSLCYATPEAFAAELEQQ